MYGAINNRKIKYFNIAKEVSKLSTYNKQHLGCVVVYKKQVLSVGYNQEKTHTLQAIYNQYREFNHYDNCAKIHAETDALSKIRHLDIDWSRIEIYIYRERKDTNERALAYPCRACQAMIRQLGIRNIYYTGEDSYCYEYTG